MELIKNSINKCDYVAKGMAQIMAEGDVIVPDTKPDILKLIQVDSDASIKDKYIENGKLVICGRVDYKVLYVPDRENEKIKSIETSMEYKQVIDAGEADDEAYILAKSTIDRVEFNTLNSRKLHLRAIVHTDYEVCNINIIEVCSDIKEDAEKQISNLLFENTVNISEHEFTVKERLEIPSGENSVCEILKTDVKINDTEYKSVTGKVIVKGAVEICILYVDDNGDIKFTEAECPFTEVLDASEISDDTICDIDYSILCVTAVAEPDIDGDLREIVVDIDVSASIKASNTIEESILKDCFIPHANSQCIREKITLKSISERPVSQNMIREIIDVPDNIPSVSEIYNILTNAIIAKSELQNGKIICEGKIETYILYLSDSNENPIYSLKKDIPFSYMIECKNDVSGLECQIKTMIKHSSYNLNSNGEIEVRCHLSIECMLIKEIIVENITDIILNPCNDRQGIVIYFADKDEKIWDIAKRYNVSCDSLGKFNDIDGDKLEESCKLFIPMI